MNRKSFLALYALAFAVWGIRADEVMQPMMESIVTPASGGADFLDNPVSGNPFSDMTSMLRNMTPEQRKDFDEYLDTVQSMYGSKFSADPASYIAPAGEKIQSSLKGGLGPKEEDGFFVEEAKRLLSFDDIVGGVPDGVMLTVKSLKKKRSSSITEDESGAGKRRKNASYRLLLYGPPGTGKTTMAEAFAREIDASFIRVKGTAFIDGYIATGTDRIRKLFEKARGLNEPVVVFIDEVDAIGRERTKERNDEYANTLVALIQELDQCEREAADRVFVILATNKYATLDEALRSRFSNTAIEIKAPSSDLGQKIMQYYLNDYEHERLSKSTLWWIKFWTRGFAGRDYENMINKAYLLAGEGKITKEHLLKAMNEACANRSSGDKEKDSWFKKFTEKYSSPWSTSMSAISYTSNAVMAMYGAYTLVNKYLRPQVHKDSDPLVAAVDRLTNIVALYIAKGAAPTVP